MRFFSLYFRGHNMFEELKVLGRAALGEATYVLDKIESNLNEAENKSALELKTAERQIALERLSGPSKSCTDKDIADIRSTQESLRAAKSLIGGSKRVVAALWQTETQKPAAPTATTEAKTVSSEVDSAKQVAPAVKKQPQTNNAVFNLVLNAVGDTSSELLGAAREVAGYALEGVGTLAWKSLVDVAKMDPKDIAVAFVCAHPQLIGVCLAVNYWDLSSAHEDYKKNPTTYNFLRVAWHSLTFSTRAVRLIDASAGSGASISSSDEGGSGASSTGSQAAVAAGGDAATASESSTNITTLDVSAAVATIDLYADHQVGDQLLDVFHEILLEPSFVADKIHWYGIDKSNEEQLRFLLCEAHVIVQRRMGAISNALREAMNDEIMNNTENVLERVFAKHPEAVELVDQLNDALNQVRPARYTNSN